MGGRMVIPRALRARVQGLSSSPGAPRRPALASRYVAGGPSTSLCLCVCVTSTPSRGGLNDGLLNEAPPPFRFLFFGGGGLQTRESIADCVSSLTRDCGRHRTSVTLLDRMYLRSVNGQQSCLTTGGRGGEGRGGEGRGGEGRGGEGRGGEGRGECPTLDRHAARQTQSLGGPCHRLPRAGLGATQTTTDPVRDRRSEVSTHDAHAHAHMHTQPRHFFVLTGGAGGPAQSSRWSMCAHSHAVAVRDTWAAVHSPRHDA